MVKLTKQNQKKRNQQGEMGKNTQTNKQIRNNRQTNLQKIPG
jgi:hypothetical protein